MRRYAFVLTAIGLVMSGLVTMASCASHVEITGTAPLHPTASIKPSTPSLPATAIEVCRSALTGRTVVSSVWTTVGELRTFGYSGPIPHRPLKNAFPDAAPSDPALWCWTKDAPNSYTAWGVRASEAPRHALTVVGPMTVTPSGPPRVP